LLPGWRRQTFGLIDHNFEHLFKPRVAQREMLDPEFSLKVLQWPPRTNGRSSNDALQTGR
jgi:hypothetical protein